jgi:hypothetical protein
MPNPPSTHQPARDTPASSETITPATRGAWGRNGEQGSAFRGLSRGRGAGGGPIRKGRGGRGPPRGTKGTGDESKIDVPAPKFIPPAPITLATEKPARSSKTVPVKPASTSRRPSRNVPAMVIDPVYSNLELASAASADTTARSSNRRRRSQQHNKPLTTDKLAPPIEQNIRPPRSYSGPASPIAPYKNTPPHMAGPEIASFDMRTNIDALVERVRAVAMAENRPTTPRSHIDWAGDDDDSLPDLNDWGVITSADDKGETISPIFVDGLKPLPDATVKPITFSCGLESPVDSMTENCYIVHNANDGVNDGATTSVESVSLSDNFSRGERENLEGTGRVSRALDSPALNGVVPVIFSELSPAQEHPATVVEPLKTPFHPSLPPKPVAAAENLPELRAGGTPVQAADPLIVSMAVGKSPVGSAQTSAVSALGQSRGQVRNAAAEQEVDQVPLSTAPLQKVHEASAVKGLAASIHAPKALLEPSSASNSISHGSLSTAGNGFSPTHNRASTVGRFPHSYTAPVNSYTESGTSTPGRYFGPSETYHARTHSTPPSGHRMLQTRPVITGDAISRLARTLLPSRATGVSASRE